MEKKALNIVVDDLNATLEAHREWNRANNFQFVPTAKEEVGKPSVREQSTQSFAAARRETFRKFDNREKPCWPADSVQRIEREGFTNREDIADRRAQIAAQHDILEYEGEYQLPQNEWAIRDGRDSRLLRPWLAYLNDHSQPNYSARLSAEMQAFETYMMPTVAESKSVRELEATISQLVAGKCDTQMVGSRIRGLASPVSDVDLRVTPKQPFSPLKVNSKRGGDKNRNYTIAMLRYVLQALHRFQRRKREPFADMEIIYGKVPIVRARDVRSGVVFEIQGPTKTDHQDELVETYMTDMPYLRPIFLILRHCLRTRSLTSVWEGGLGSYPLLMMIATALKRTVTAKNGGNMGDQMLKVLRFWADADTYKTGYLVEPSGIFDKETGVVKLIEGHLSEPQRVCLDAMVKYDPKKPYKLCLQDPADYSNDLAKKCYGIKHIQKTFNYLHQEVSALLCTKEASDRVPSTGFSVLAPILEADYSNVEWRRSRLDLWYSGANIRSTMLDADMRVNEIEDVWADLESLLKHDLLRRAEQCTCLPLEVMERDQKEEMKRSSDKWREGLVRKYQTSMDTKYSFRKTW